MLLSLRVVTSGPKEFLFLPHHHHPAAFHPYRFAMRKDLALIVAVSIGLLALAFGPGLGFAVAQDNVQSSANFYAQTSDGECGLEFTIVSRNRTIKGSIAWSDLSLRLRGVPESFVVVNGKLAE